MNFYINNKNYEKTLNNLTILQACEINDISIPRFCYHEKLSIAGNCRMCLVELEKSPKPVASCALPILDNMKIFTDTNLVKKAREGILEFLLINHPLDCPICDWGGECDLQDQTQVFGGDRGRYYEMKRSVSDKNCGPLIKTFMTRCIHCTRCVRFYSEVAGIFSLGTTGRGSKMEIGSYILEDLDSELSGNLIDLCPVGALTSKPSAFLGRPWDFESFKTIDPLDGLGSNIQIDLYGLSLIRVLPVINEFVNEEWISDKSRFFLDGIMSQRLQKPLLKKNLKFLPISWDFALDILYKKIILKNYQILGFFGPLIDLETLIGFKKFLNFFGSNNIFYQKNLLLPNLDLRSNFNFNFNEIKSKKYDVILFLGLNLRNESSVLNARIRKYCLNSSSIIGSIGSNFISNFKINKISNNFLDLILILKGKHWFSNYIFSSKSILILVGLSIFFNKNGIFIWNFLNKIKIKLQNLYNICLNFYFLSPIISLSNSIEIGLNIKKIGNLNLKKKIIYLLGISQNFDYNSYILKNSKNFIVFQGHHGNNLTSNSDLILPTPTFIEKTGHFLTLQGFVEKATKILTPFGDSRLDLEIFQYLGLKFNIESLKNIESLHSYKYLNKFNLKKIYKFYDLNSNLNYFSSIYKYKNKIIEPLYTNNYITDSISESSLTLSLTFNKFIKNKPNFIK